MGAVLTIICAIYVVYKLFEDASINGSLERDAWQRARQMGQDSYVDGRGVRHWTHNRKQLTTKEDIDWEIKSYRKMCQETSDRLSGRKK